MNGLLTLFRPKRSDWFNGLLYAEEQTKQGNYDDLQGYVAMALDFGDHNAFDDGIEDYIDHYEKFLEEPEEELPDAVSTPYCRNPLPV